MDFLEEKVFDREQYDTYIRRIHYDDRDAVMYEKMLHFLFPYIVEERGIEDRVGLMEEYIHWNEQLIEKCLYHLPHDVPYINICRAYQSVVLLLAGKLEEGIEQLRKIGTENFQYAFTVYGDEGHTEHDLFYRQQVEQYEEVLFYPIYQRVYKAGRGPQDFFVYYDVEKSVPVSHIILI